MRGIFRLSVSAFFAIVVFVGPAVGAQTIPPKYEKPAQSILDVLNAPPPPELSPSPAGDVALVYTPELYPSIYDLSRPMLRLAGLRMNPANNGAHNPPRFTDFFLVRLTDGSQTKLALPSTGQFGRPVWSPDGTHFALFDSGKTAVELWIGDGRTGAVRVVLNSTLGEPCRWTAGSRALVCTAVPVGRAAPPRPPEVPGGPAHRAEFRQCRATTDL